MIDRRRLAWLIFGLIYGKSGMEQLPNIGEPFGRVVGGQIYINPVWYESLKRVLNTMPSKDTLDFIAGAELAYTPAASAQNNAYTAHQRVAELTGFVRLMMLGMEDAGFYPGWSNT